MLLLRGESEFLEVHHARIIKTPLHEIDRINNCGPAGRLTRLGDALFAALEFQRACGVAQLGFAIDDRQGHAISQFIDFGDEFGAARGR